MGRTFFWGCVQTTWTNEKGGWGLLIESQCLITAKYLLKVSNVYIGGRGKNYPKFCPPCLYTAPLSITGCIGVIRACTPKKASVQDRCGTVASNLSPYYLQ